MIETLSAAAIGQLGARPHCPVCSDSQRVHFSFRHYSGSIYACASCRVQFQFPQPTDERLNEIYSSDYFLGSTDTQALENQRALKFATARLYMDILQPFVHQTCAGPHHPRLLEIGCGHGELLVEAQSRGFQVEGLEYSAHAASHANSQLGHAAVKIGSPETDPLPVSTYDVIGAFDAIEHLRDPKHALMSMHSALRPGGIVAIVTPSLDSWSHRLLGRHWMEYKTEHLTYFSRKSLSKILTNIGFNNVKFHPNYKTLNVTYIAAHFERFPVPILTSIVRLFKRMLPASAIDRPFRIVASGIMVIAAKPA